MHPIAKHNVDLLVVAHLGARRLQLLELPSAVFTGKLVALVGQIALGVVEGFVVNPAARLRVVPVACQLHGHTGNTRLTLGANAVVVAIAPHAAGNRGASDGLQARIAAALHAQSVGSIVLHLIEGIAVLLSAIGVVRLHGHQHIAIATHRAVFDELLAQVQSASLVALDVGILPHPPRRAHLQAAGSEGAQLAHRDAVGHQHHFIVHAALAPLDRLVVLIQLHVARHLDAIFAEGVDTVGIGFGHLRSHRHGDARRLASS